MRNILTGRQWLIAIGLAVLILAALVGVFLTRNAGLQDVSTQAHHLPPIVDERPLQTAQNVAKLSSSWDEQRFAGQTMRVTDHAVDLAFTDALRDATNHPAQPTPQTQSLYAHLNKAQEQVQHEQDRVDELKKQLASASGARQDAIQQQLDLAQAQLELNQDDVDSARTDLIRSGVDKLSRVQRQFKHHEDTEHGSDANRSLSSPTATPINYQSGTWWGQIQAWRALHQKIAQLQGANDEATQIVASLTQTHTSLQQQLTADKAAATASSQPPPANVARPASPAQPSISALKALSDDQKTLADLSRRLQDMEEAQAAYGNWIALVRNHQLVAVHGMIESVLWILLIVLLVYISDRVIDHYLTPTSGEFNLFHTLRVVIRFAVQALGVILVLFVIFGVPQQMPTILGFAGAGLTVALKDFIVGFFGWFVLMGKNGLRVGDWVEIDGVAGEVIEINLLRTVLLETGNWAPTGHPTGRKVSFVNSYAIEGHFFNFTTSGQWLWDELKYSIPADHDPYAVVEAIQQTVAKESEANVKAAEEEWRRLSQRYRVRSVSAAPAVNVHPTSSGVEVEIRYITRAHERYAMRSRLNQAIVDLLHRGVASEEQTASAARRGD
jgi:small-conductance mechanosensitive channel